MKGGSDIELHIDVTNWPKATEQGVRSLFLAVYDELSEAFGVKVPVPVYLSWHVDVPRTQSFPDRTKIFLSARGIGWSQFVYQAAHEITHALIRDFSWITGQQRHKWFEEALCEMASYVVLSKFASTWPLEPVEGLASFEATQRYAIEHQIYLQNNMDKVLPLPEDLQSWFRSNEHALTTDPYLRELNAVISVALLPEFLNFPRLWRDCAHLNQWDTTQDETFKDYLKSWWSHMRSKNVHPQGVPLGVANLLDLDIGVRRVGKPSLLLREVLPDLQIWDHGT